VINFNCFFLLLIIFTFEIPRCLMGKPDWLREAVAAAAAHDPEYCVINGNFIADGDEKRFDIVFRPQHYTDAFAVIQQFRKIARFGGRFYISAAKPRLGAADGGNIEKESQVSGNPQTTRVGNTLPVHDDQVRRMRNFFKSLQNQRRFTER
jgi:hypothetical protein